MAKIYIGGNTLNISRENTKMGRIHSFSLVPGLTCPAGVPCKGTCYAEKACRMYKDTLRTYQENTRSVILLPRERIVRALVSFIKGKGLKVFRWNVAGDFIIPKYWDIAVQTAELCPETQFLAFTKVYATEKQYRPKTSPLSCQSGRTISPGRELQHPSPIMMTGHIPSRRQQRSVRGNVTNASNVSI